MTRIAKLSIVSAILVGIFIVPAARAAEPPSDLCTLLSPEDVSKALGHPYGAPDKSTAPRPFANTVEGADCRYPAKDGHGKTLWFRAYADASPSQATDLFARLSQFYGTPTQVQGLGDQAYFDKDHALHARKGRVRFYLDDRASNPTGEQPLKDLGMLVASRL